MSAARRIHPGQPLRLRSRVPAVPSVVVVIPIEAAPVARVFAQTAEEEARVGAELASRDVGAEVADALDGLRAALDARRESGQ